jgi:hypothetical protein
MAASCGGGVLPSSSGQYHLQAVAVADTKAVASYVGGASGNSVLPICSKRGSDNNSKKQSLLSQTFVPAVGPKFSRGLAKGNNNGAIQEHRSLVSGLRRVPHLSLSLSLSLSLCAFWIDSGAFFLRLIRDADQGVAICEGFTAAAAVAICRISPLSTYLLSNFAVLSEYCDRR